MTTLYIEVAPGMPLPNPGDDINTKSDLTGIVYRCHIKSIKSLRWMPNGHIEVVARASRESVEASA